MLPRQASHLDSPPGGWSTPKSAYLHVPFCRHRCGYCNFSVVAGRDDLIDRYLAAIDRELAALDRPMIETLFIGGGTPTHLPVKKLERFLRIVSDRFEIAPHVEWSTEANPEDITAEKLGLLSAHGVNRISLGVQSFNADKLRVLERSHDGEMVCDTIRQTADSIANVSIDLIFAAPDETLEVWLKDLRTALLLPISHLSTYALTFEKGTSFWSRQFKGELSGTTESVEVQMYNAAREGTSRAGLEHYEISSFARAGSMCQHNLAYWHGRGWFAAGPGAARFVNGRRELNHRSTTTYLRKMELGQSPIAETDVITPLQHARERAAFGIRMLAGIDIAKISRETGVDLETECGDAIESSMKEGWIHNVGRRLCLTKEGVLFADAVAAEFL
ncbi:MAG: radical SAM family heme chaperone HemW [Pirellulaceae bacterium]